MTLRLCQKCGMEHPPSVREEVLQALERDRVAAALVDLVSRRVELEREACALLAEPFIDGLEIAARIRRRGK